MEGQKNIETPAGGENQNDFLGFQPVGKLLLQLAVPSITAQLINMLYNIVDRIYIGHIEGVGHLALSGVGVVFPVIMLITAFCNLVGMGGAPLASIRMGRKENRQAEKILGNCFVLLVLLAAVITVVFFVFARPLLLLFGASQETVGYGLDYMRVYVLGTVFVMIALGLNPFISAQGFARVSMYTTLIGAALNIVLDPVFIFLLGMGVQGAAVATVLSQGVSALWVLRFLSGEKTVWKLRKRDFKPALKILGPVMALGLSPFVMMSTESLLSIAFNTSLQKYGGDLAVASMTVLSSLMQVCLMPIQGLAQGAQPIISYNYGAGNIRRVREAFWLLLKLSVGFASVFWAACLLAPEVFVSIFAQEEALREMAAWALRIYMGGILMMGVQNACQQTFVALGKAGISLFLALLRKMILLIPLIYLLPGLLEDKVFAVLLAEPVSDVTAACVTFLLFCLTLRKMMNNTKGQGKAPESPG